MSEYRKMRAIILAQQQNSNGMLDAQYGDGQIMIIGIANNITINMILWCPDLYVRCRPKGKYEINSTEQYINNKLNIQDSHTFDGICAKRSIFTNNVLKLESDICYLGNIQISGSDRCSYILSDNNFNMILTSTMVKKIIDVVSRANLQNEYISPLF